MTEALKKAVSQFQSTLPVRGATYSKCDLDNMIIFQSTLPVRGATRHEMDKMKLIEISIHAPRAGSDYPMDKACSNYKEFQSTLPVRGATRQRIS